MDSVTRKKQGKKAAPFAQNRQLQSEKGRKKATAVGAALPGIQEDGSTNLPHPHGVRNVENH